MSDLYKEAIVEAKKLRKIAEEDATKAIIKEISPYIKKVISEQIQENSPGSQFFFEQDDEDDELKDLASVASDATPQQPAATPAPVPAEQQQPMGDQENQAPVAAGMPQSEDNDDIGTGTSMPDEEGKITVDFEDLFKGVEDVAEPEESEQLATPEETPPTGEGGLEVSSSPTSTEEGGEEEEKEPTPVPTTSPMESLLYNNFEKTLSEISGQIDRVFFSDSVNDIVYESLKNKLFSLVENLDQLKEKGEINNKKAKINENKLEFLFLKLKEAKMPNSYNKKDQDKENSMASLKEYAAKLFSEENSTYADEAKEDGTDQGTTASGKHAADVSGVSPDVGGPEDVDASAVNEEMLPGTAGSVDHESLPGTDPEPGSEEQWAAGEPALDEKDQDKVIEEALDSLVSEEVEAEGHAGFGDSNEDPPVEFEVDDKELAEAVQAIKKESVRKKIKAIKEASDGKDNVDSWEDAEPEEEDPSHKNLKEGLMSEDDDEEKEDNMVNDVDPETGDVEDMEMAPATGDEEGEEDLFLPPGEEGEEPGEEGDLVLNIDLPDEVEDALADVDVSVLDDIDVSLADVNLGKENEEGKEGEEGAEHMEPSASPVGDEESEEGEMSLEGHKPEHGEPDMHEEMTEAKKAMSESKKLLKSLTLLKRDNTSLKQNLKEANLFLAKNVYFTKFLQRGDLSKKNLGKIVDYLDSAQTVAEAKTIYGKIKAKLAESTSVTSKKLAGSSSKVTTPGSPASLHESAQHKEPQNPNNPSVASVERWQQLAGVKNKK